MVLAALDSPSGPDSGSKDIPFFDLERLPRLCYIGGMVDHDNAYKSLFSNPEMVVDLLRGFVKEDWVASVDFSTLEKANGSYISDDLRDRHSDVIWRVRLRDQWLYVYILIEFQSEVDPFMAVRIMTYIGLLYQDLIKTGRLSGQSLLPPVLPLVLYNGKPRWQAPTEVSELIMAGPGHLQDYRPRGRFLLIDEGATPSADLKIRNLVARLFELEQSRTPGQIKTALEALIDWFRSPAQTALRRSFVVWIGRVLLPGKLPDTEFPEFRDLQEVPPMIEETIQEWKQQWKTEGRAEGRAEGSQLIACRLLARGESPSSVAEITGLPLAEVERLAKRPSRVSEPIAPYSPAPTQPK